MTYRVGDKLSETQKRILSLMQQNPSVSAQTLSEEIDISKRKKSVTPLHIREDNRLQTIKHLSLHHSIPFPDNIGR